MQDDSTPTATPKRRQIDNERQARQARVAAALRENLLKRKAQQRARADSPTPASDDPAQVPG
jgi:hypothetical protein